MYLFTSIAIYLRDFYRKKLYTFLDCKKHYDHVTVDQLKTEAAWMFAPPVKKLPFQLTFPRYYALFYEVMERAVCAPYLDNKGRHELIDIAIRIKEEIMQRVHPAMREEMQRIIRINCEKVQKMGRYKKAGDCILASNHKGTENFTPPPRKVVIHAGNNQMH